MWNLRKTIKYVASNLHRKQVLSSKWPGHQPMLSVVAHSIVNAMGRLPVALITARRCPYCPIVCPVLSSSFSMT